PTPKPAPQTLVQSKPAPAPPPSAPLPQQNEPKPPPPARVVAEPAVTPRPPAVETRAPAPVQPRPVIPPVPKTSRPVEPKQEPVTAFDADLSTILYASDRKLAIVDGRIVGVGDTVRGARIVEITPTTVMLRDGQGKLRRLALAGTGK